MNAMRSRRFAVSITIDTETDEILTKIGGGNRSAGIRILASEYLSRQTGGVSEAEKQALFISKSGQSFKTLANDISTINPKAVNVYEVCDSMLDRIALADCELDPVQCKILAGLLNNVYPLPKPGKMALEETIRLRRRRQAPIRDANARLHALGLADEEKRADGDSDFVETSPDELNDDNWLK